MLDETLHFLNQRMDFYSKPAYNLPYFRVKKNANIAFLIKEEIRILLCSKRWFTRYFFNGKYFHLFLHLFLCKTSATD